MTTTGVTTTTAMTTATTTPTLPTWPNPPKELTATRMQHMWSALKEYFADSFLLGSGPTPLCQYLCQMMPEDADKADRRAWQYGANVAENSFPLFSTLRGVSKPECTCGNMADMVARVDAFVAMEPDYRAGDYDIVTDKDDRDVDLVGRYAMRDSLCWWAHWTGRPLTARDYWKYQYTAFATVFDDIQVPPADFLDGTYKVCGRGWPECRAGLLAEGMTPAAVRAAELALWRNVLLQYLEKTDPGLRALLLRRTTLMTQFHTMTADVWGVGVCLLAAEGEDAAALDAYVARGAGALDLAAVAQCLSMDTAKESMGVLRHERTDPVAGDRERFKRELRWLFGRATERIAAEPYAHVCMRFGTSGFHFTPMMDRYLERAAHRRIPMSEEAVALIARLQAEATPPRVG